MMSDWSTGVEPRNCPILRKNDSRSLSELLASILCVLSVAGALVGHLWIRGRIVEVGYQVQRLEAREQSLKKTQNDLILQEETLKNPQDLDFYARNVLGMEPVKPSQIIPFTRGVEADRPVGLALANPMQSKVPPRNTSANN
jgi:hypothetical protein